MARRRLNATSGEQIGRALQGAPQLRSFIIPNVRPTGRQLGGGSYGTVEELEIDGLICAGKKLYDALIDPENQGAQRMVDKYYNECRLLSGLRHPHIVQFLGICFVPDSRLPVLVMERLQGSLDELLESTASIPLSMKVSILQDVARGLVYLHHHSPSVIHRDLSARNVLLNSAMTAKIADMGNSRIVDLPPGQLAQTMSQGIPGTQVYMPPEALSSNPRYGPPLDMFSFGHLTLFTATQVFPRDLLTPTYHDPLTNRVKGRNEIERRGKYFDMLYERFDKSDPLVVLIKGCLEYDASKRPTARQALERLGEMRAAFHNPYSDLNRLQLETTLTEKEAEIQQIPLLRSELEQITEQRAELERAYRAKNEILMERETEFQQIPPLRTELEQLRVEKSALEEVCKGKDEVLAAKEHEIAARERAVSDERQRVNSLTDECATLKGVLEGKAEEIGSLQAHNRTLQAERDETIVTKDAEMAVKEVYIAAKERENAVAIAGKNKQLAAKDQLILAYKAEIAEKDQGLISLKKRCTSLQTELEMVQRRNQSLEASQSTSDDLLAVKDSHIAALQTELRGQQKILQPKAKVPRLPSMLTFNLPLKWKKPIKMFSGVVNTQAVVIGGKVYTGGGWTKGTNYKLSEYTIQGGQWREIDTPVHSFGMAVVNNQLIIAGGKKRSYNTTNKVWVLDSSSHTWSQPFPAMPTEKWSPSAVGYKRWVLVVGGLAEKSVEILDTASRQWYVATPLPGDALQPSLAVIEDTLYVLWEFSAVSVSIPMLILSAMTQCSASNTSSGPKPTEWQPLRDTPANKPAIASFHGSLIALGGDLLSSTVTMYIPQTKQWLKVAKLPIPRRSCTCAVIPETEELMVIGGRDKNNDDIKSIDLCTL